VKRIGDRVVWIVALGPLLLLGPALAQGRVLFWGTPLLQFLPWRTYALAVLRQGYLPLWNPLVGMGAPLLANYQSAVLYPPNLLLALGDPAWISTLLVMLHLILAGVGMAVLARRLGMDSLGQSVAGLAFGLSGYLVARSGFFSINATAAWLPWVIVAVDRVVLALPMATSWRKRVGTCIPLAVVLALQWTAGHAQTAWYTLVLMAAWILWRSLRGGVRALGITVAGIAAAGALAFALASPQLLPTLEYLLQSHRAGTLDTEYALAYSFWPWRFLGLLAPGAFGSPVMGDYWGYGNFWEDAIYVGVLPLLLAVVALVRGFLRRGPHVSLTRFLVAVGVVTSVLALGKHTPVFPWLFRWVPTFGLFQAPTRWMLIFVFGCSLLAGAGATAWKRVEGRALYWSRLGSAGAGGMAVVAWLAPRVVSVAAQPTLIRVESISRSIALAGSWLLLAGVLVLLRRQQPSAAWSAAVALVVLADLVVAGCGLNPLTPEDLYRGSTSLAGRLVNGGRVYMSAELEQQAKFSWAFRFDTFTALEDWRQVREAGLPNVTLLEGIPSASNFDPLQPQRWATWMTALESKGRPDSLLQLMDVGWVAESVPSQDVPVEFGAVPGSERVRIVPEATPVESGDAALDAMTASGFDPGSEVIVEPSAGQPLPASGGSGNATLMSTVDPNRVVVQAETNGPAWLVLSDTWYPGWQARLDGEQVPIWRGDYLFRAVPVPAGTHVVEFAYRPMSFLTGVLLAGAAIVLLAWAIWFSRLHGAGAVCAAPS
jgi:Bacterial membrane protein YfhO